MGNRILTTDYTDFTDFWSWGSGGLRAWTGETVQRVPHREDGIGGWRPTAKGAVEHASEKFPLATRVEQFIRLST
jgi:hypothetical protein